MTHNTFQTRHKCDHGKSSRITHLFIDMDDTLMPCGIYYQAVKDRVAYLINRRLPHVSKEEVLAVIDVADARQAEIYGFGIERFPSTIQHTLTYYLGDYWGWYGKHLGLTVFYRDYQLFDGVYETLKSIPLPKIIVTKGEWWVQMKKYRDNHLDEVVDDIHVVPWKKKENYLHVLDLLQLSPEQVMMIGDSIRDDIAIPKALGMKTCHVQTKKPSWGYENISESADFTIPSINDLPSVLVNL